MYTNPHPSDYFSKYPLYVGDIIPNPYQVGDFPPPKDLVDLIFPQTKWSIATPNEKPVWFEQTDGGEKFVLELAGYKKDQISVEIKNDGISLLQVKGKRTGDSFSREFSIPNVNKIDLFASVVVMENGLLEILFPPKKKVKSDSIKLL